MKKETKTEITYWWPVSILVILVIVIGGIMIYLERPEFKITKEECWNMTGEIGFDNFDEEEEQGFGINENILSYKIKRYGVYKIDNLFCVNYLRQQGHTDFLLHSCEYYEEGVGLDIIGSELINEGGYFSYGEKISYSIYPEKIEEIFPEEFTFNEEKVYLKDGKIINENTFYYIIADIIKNQTICEQIEVENNIIDWCYFEDSCGQIKIGDPSWEIKWLDENCKCVEVYDKDKKEKFLCGENEKYLCGAFTNRPTYFECSKYKCGENYFVEVLK